jgi:hypothetical protein
MALLGFQGVVLLARGPFVDRYTWFGYRNGLRRKKVSPSTQAKDVGDFEQGSEEKAVGDTQ